MTRYIYLSTAVVLFAALMGATIYLTLSYRALLRSHESIRYDYERYLMLANVAYQPRYATITGIDPIAHTVTVSILRKYSHDTEKTPLFLTIHVTENTVIAKQTLISEQGAYVALSPFEITSLDQLRVGMRVLVQPLFNDNDISALLIIYGDPL